ncbi:hypothetical protein [Halovivax limisalsi]|uniref:hypothetical protein n=1 Tax=Halovivax limisalsi TaxID=1453760 RepID=UPI001FFCEBED|nr:hypothetical protein [Halovivax limisalsi]
MYRCTRCDDPVAPDADACPACGYNPGRTAMDAGAVCLAIGLPLLYAVTPAGVLCWFVALLAFGYGLLATPGERVA